MTESVIKQKVDLIAECIFDKVQKTEWDSFGLYSGEFGRLLFLLYYSRYSQSEKHALLTEQYAVKLMEQFAEKENQHTFCSGLSGILYLFDFLREQSIIDLDISDVQPLLENYIVSKMRWDIRQMNYDFMHGALGVGLYFLKRRTNPEYIRELIDFLYDTAEKDKIHQIFKWESVIDHEKNLIGYNLSLCHGISSIIIFLSRVVRIGMSDEEIREMLSGAVRYVLSQQKDSVQFGSFFPNFIIKNLPESVSKSRMAWCYGDLGIGLALWQAGKALEKMEWKEKGLEILLQSTQRRTYHDSYAIDAGICHGSAGIAMTYRRMFFETQRDEFKDTALFWINQTLDFSSHEDGLAGYRTFVKDCWKCDYSLLTGISGIGLVLLSYLEDDQQEWDEMLLLS
ncbi:MAG: lanthionine synthetase C family protein [Prevotella sp.]|jgi:lantibiotic modifying enzyme|nr:lanthionine synthetase C family protein [Prevotella sp.]